MLVGLIPVIDNNNNTCTRNLICVTSVIPRMCVTVGYIFENENQTQLQRN